MTFRTEIGDRQRCHFNSHAHVERDKTRTVNNLIAEISTHTLTRSVTERWRNKIWWDCNFNSHAHVERDHCKPIRRSKCRISTHTLTWSVTSTLWATYSLKIISTHTLTWSVTSLRRWAWLQIVISTHTLTWSVTICIVFILIRGIFQLTRSRGAWQPLSYWNRC